MRSKIVVMDYGEGKIKTIDFDNNDDSEEILTERYDFNLSNIDWMVVDKLIVEVA